MKKRIMSVNLILAMLLSLLPFAASSAVAEQESSIIRDTAAAEAEMLSGAGEKGEPGTYRTGHKTPAGHRNTKGIVSGDCGASLTWSYNDETGVLTISGSGDMDDFPETVPWENVCQDIREILLPDGLTSIGDFAFFCCDALESVTIPDTVSSIGEGAFAYCNMLQTVHLPTELETLETGAFAYCASLSDINWPEKLTTLGDYAFQDCAFKSAELSANAVFDARVFLNCKNLKTVSVAPENSLYQSKDGVVFSKDGSVLVLYPAARDGDTYTVPEGVTEIGQVAFCATVNLRQVILPEGLRVLQESAFYCSSVEQAELPESLEETYDFVFAQSNVKSLQIPDGLKKLAYWGWKDCKKLESVTLGSGIRYIEMSTFSGCTALKTVEFSPNSQIGVLWDCAFQDCTSLERIVLPEGITLIRNGCFDGCASLKEIVLPSTLQRIAYRAFGNCPALETITLPEGLLAINRLSFQNDTALRQLNFPDSLSYICRDAFEGCTALESTIPADFTRDLSGHYYRCEKVTVAGERDSDDAAAVLELLNAERAAEGLPALKYDAALSQKAMLRAAELTVLFSHDRPVAQSVLDSFKDAYGENIAYGYSSPESVMAGWMNSPGHRANILYEDFTDVGIGCFRMNGVTYWVQLFGVGKGSGTPESGTRSVSEEVLVYTAGSNEKTMYTPEEEEEHLSGINIYTPFYTMHISEEVVELPLSGGYTLSASITCGDASVYLPAGMVKWSAEPESIVGVEGQAYDGFTGCFPVVLTPLDAGKGVVTAQFGALSASCEVSVAQSHVHSYGAWQFDGTEHWRSCEGCGERTEIARHTLQEKVTEEPTQDTDGLKRVWCGTCGYEYFEDIPKTGSESETACNGGVNCPGSKFNDMPAPGNWAHAGIDFVLKQKLFDGTSGVTFEPDTQMSRAMMVTVLWRLDGKTAAHGSNPFTDVKEETWYTNAVLWAAENSVVNGVAPDKFEPDGNITREQMAAIMYRYASAKGYDITGADDLSGFPDTGKVNAYALPAVKWAVAEGLINGNGGRLDPQGNATRAQVATILMRYIQNVVEN